MLLLVCLVAALDAPLHHCVYAVSAFVKEKFPMSSLRSMVSITTWKIFIL